MSQPLTKEQQTYVETSEKQVQEYLASFRRHAEDIFPGMAYRYQLNVFMLPLSEAEPVTTPDAQQAAQGDEQPAHPSQQVTGDAPPSESAENAPGSESESDQQ